MKKSTTPYIIHLFVCTNDRHGERQSCADNQAAELKKSLKQFIKVQGWQGKVRISNSGCLGVCAYGANIMIYPQQIWYQQVTVADLPEIEKLLIELMRNR